MLTHDNPSKKPFKTNKVFNTNKQQTNAKRISISVIAYTTIAVKKHRVKMIINGNSVTVNCTIQKRDTSGQDDVCPCCVLFLLQLDVVMQKQPVRTRRCVSVLCAGFTNFDNSKGQTRPDETMCVCAVRWLFFADGFDNSKDKHVRTRRCVSVLCAGFCGWI